MADDLEEFRAQWKAELNLRNKKDEILEDDNQQITAFKLYQKALKYESDGKPFKAVSYYKKAFKLDPSLEFSKELQMEAFVVLRDSLPESSYPQVEIRVPQKKETAVTSGEETTSSIVPNWAASFVDSPCVAAKAAEDTVHISVLPCEVLIHIFQNLDSTSVERAGSVCRYWFLVSREQAIWRDLCFRTWPEQIKTLRKNVGNKFGGSWRKMFLEKPRPRLDGVYISTNSYVRSGQTEGNFHQPVFKIDYWRYLRFFEDGRTIMICSPEKPKVVVPLMNFVKTKKNTPIDYGKYEIQEDGAIFIQSIKHTPSHPTYVPEFEDPVFSDENQLCYCFLLRLGSSSRGWHDRFFVTEYFSQVRGQQGHFPHGMVDTFKFLSVPDHILNPSLRVEEQ